MTWHPCVPMWTIFFCFWKRITSGHTSHNFANNFLFVGPNRSSSSSFYKSNLQLYKIKHFSMCLHLKLRRKKTTTTTFTHISRYEYNMFNGYLQAWILQINLISFLLWLWICVSVCVCVSTLYIQFVNKSEWIFF